MSAPTLLARRRHVAFEHALRAAEVAMSSRSCAVPWRVTHPCARSP